mmetsp:Transcript_7553/g.22268  ORF Transcript_7553/g.22268 Transcript_7553/m.22268 type:complete len:236 (+) Transcript_7553:306-1013(+)
MRAPAARATCRETLRRRARGPGSTRGNTCTRARAGARACSRRSTRPRGRRRSCPARPRGTSCSGCTCVWTRVAALHRGYSEEAGRGTAAARHVDILRGRGDVATRIFGSSDVGAAARTSAASRDRTLCRRARGTSRATPPARPRIRSRGSCPRRPPSPFLACPRRKTQRSRSSRRPQRSTRRAVINRRASRRPRRLHDEPGARFGERRLCARRRSRCSTSRASSRSAGTSRRFRR